MTSHPIGETLWWKQYSASVRTGETHEVELLVRSFSPSTGGHNRRSGLVERLNRATAAGFLDDYETTVIGDRFCLCESCHETSTGRQLTSKLVEVRNWRAGAAEPVGFDEKEVHSSITGERYRVLTPPALCVTVTIDDRIKGVFPCSIDGEQYGVEDFFDVLETAGSRFQSSRVNA
jgi:hypothetical protein